MNSIHLRLFKKLVDVMTDSIDIFLSSQGKPKDTVMGLEGI